MAVTGELALEIARFRRFNRNYTKFLGTLGEGFLGTEYSLAEARLLYEIGAGSEARAKDIADSLGLDRGYISRVLARFENDGLLKRTPAKDDRRYADLTLTAKGRAVFRKLNARSDAQAKPLLAALNRSQRTQITVAMRTIEELLSARGERTAAVTLRGHHAGDMGWVVHRQSIAYNEEYGWNYSDFEALVAKIVSDFLTNFDAATERCWMAEEDGYPLGHIFLVRNREQPDCAKLRLLFVEREARGRGVGRKLVTECIAFARKAGYKKVTLWTQSILTSAHQLYKEAGFVLVDEQPHHSFGKDLLGQTWEVPLNYKNE